MPEDALGAITMKFRLSRHNWSLLYKFPSKEQVHCSITVFQIENRDKNSSSSVLS